MSHWLAEVGNTQSQVIGAFIISVPWNCFHSTNSLEKPLNWLLFNRHLTQKLLKMLQRYSLFYDILALTSQTEMISGTVSNCCCSAG